MSRNATECHFFAQILRSTVLQLFLGVVTSTHVKKIPSVFFKHEGIYKYYYYLFSKVKTVGSDEF